MRSAQHWLRAGLFARVTWRLLALLAAWLALGNAAQAARLALVIGNDQYQSVSVLRNAVADAQTMADAFRKAGYQVTLTTNRDLKSLKDELRAFRRRIQGGDEVILFFSGHGVQLGGENYLLPLDVRSEGEDQVRDDAVALSSVLADIRSARPSFTLAIVDACRDNPFQKAGKSIGGRGLTRVSGATGEMVLFAAGEGQQALDRLGSNDPVRNGVFTRVFVKEMERPGVPVDQVLKAVRIEVNRLAQTVRHEQVPALYDQVLGNFYFYPPLASPPVAPVQTATLRPEPEPRPQPVAQPATAPPTVDFGIRMVSIPAGSFQMGSNKDADEKPAHRVTLKAFDMGATEVTQGQWKAVMGSNPSHFSNCGDTCPVEQVSWNDAQTFIQKLNQKTGKRYRLPSESEWEYAARAGTRTDYWWGDAIGKNNANCAGCGSRWDSKTTAPVGSFRPNAFGLYDMHGNVWEWVQDWYHDNYNGAPTDGSAWESGGEQKERVLRGGSWINYPAGLRSANRGGFTPDIRVIFIGFRLARTAP